MYRCEHCGLAFVSPLPGAAYLTEFYNRYHRLLEDGGGYELIEGRMERDFPAKLRLLRRVLGPGRHRVLDVGCGKGFFVQAALGAGFEATGIDVSPVAVEAARARGVPARCLRVEDLVARREVYAAVTFWATIEHLPDPLGTLRSIREVTAGGGTLFLDTGVGGDWLERLLPGKPQWYDPPQHLYVFSLAAMRRALQQTGFTVRSLNPCFERSLLRRLVRTARNLGCAAALRAIALVFGLRRGPYDFTRFALGNLMLVVADATGDLRPIGGPFRPDASEGPTRLEPPVT